jgi:hypothetical protein
MHPIPRTLIIGPALALALAFVGDTTSTAAAEAAELTALNDQALAAHRQRCLNEASRTYGKLLALDPPGEPSAEQMSLVLKYAPRLQRVAGEFFPLKDIVAIIHPDKPIIAYRLLWEDDIAYPSDNDPCDHEIVWIEFDPAGGQVTRVATYFHGSVLAPAAAVAEANAHDGRAWIGVEWGFHGSVPHGGLEAAMPVLQKHWQAASAVRTERPDPLARGWPTRFAGTFDDYVNFAEPNDPRPLLHTRALVWVSRWPMAVLNRYAVRYNVAVKHDWP